MLEIIIVVIAIIAIWKILHSYRLNTFDTVVAFTGGLGSGKSLLSTETAIKLLKRQRRRVWVQNLFRKKGNKKERPLLYSTIPVKISKKEWSTQLTDKHLCLQEKIRLHSVCLIDEIGGYCSQFDYKVPNSNNFEEFVRFFRHYIQGYLVVNDQCSENIVLQVRRRLNTVYNLMNCKRHFFGLIYTVRVRNINISEEIKTIEEGNTEDNMRTLIGLMPWTRRYDTHCYYCRYEEAVTKENDRKHDKYEQRELIRISKVEYPTINQRLKK